ncbi:putative translocation complex protein [Azorhizobium caulinodans ORS 571]|uniref:Protein translocase subunit SecE n=2 Tax=Xanthobacteraceae TaxID=335928 RepID=A8HTW9_AZOC5|nr:putative translocation complex protein [Azorhizobium caulinodans ORS 571]
MWHLRHWRGVPDVSGKGLTWPAFAGSSSKRPPQGAGRMARFSGGLAGRMSCRAAARSERWLQRGRHCLAGGRSDMAKNSPVEFFQQVRTETAKVTWPSRRETLITTAMVFVMVLLASIFFLVVDQILRFGVSQILSIGH